MTRRADDDAPTSGQRRWVALDDAGRDLVHLTDTDLELIFARASAERAESCSGETPG